MHGCERLWTKQHTAKRVSLSDQVAKRALQFLGLTYLEGMESRDRGGVLSELFAEPRVKKLLQLCWFFWTLRGKAETFRSHVQDIDVVDEGGRAGSSQPSRRT